MTNYRAILQYHYRGNTTTQIAKLCECSRTTVLKTIKRAKECGIDEPAFELLSDIQLLEKLYPKRVHRTGYEEPDFIALEKDKKKRGLTVFVMWRRYYKRTLAAGKKPYGKSQFFKLFKRYDKGGRDILNAINDKLLDELAMFMFENKEELPSMKGSKIVVKTTKNGLEFDFDND